MQFIALKKKILRNTYSLNGYTEIQYSFRLLNKPTKIVGLFLHPFKEAHSIKGEDI